MAAQEIGFAEIRALVRRGWRPIGVLALLFGLVAGLALTFLVPTLYLADAKLLITPLTEGYAAAPTSVGLYRVLASSDSVVEQTTEALIADGVLAEDAVLRIGRELDARAPQLRPDGTAPHPAFLVLMARHRTPETAATIVNVWARIVVEESRIMFRGTAAGSERVLGSQLDPTNIEIEEAGAELSRLLDELAEREEETTIRWDRRISAAKKKADEALADYNTSTRRLMGEAIDRLLPSEPAGAGDSIRPKLQEIVSVRAQLARAPRVLTLEKAASDETLSEVLAQGRAVNRFDNTLVTEEINPLYDQLTLKVLALESELKSLANLEPAQLTRVLAELEKIQLERAAGLMALEEESSLEVRVLQLRRGRALEDLLLEKNRIQNDFDRKLNQLSGLAKELSGQLNRSVVSRVLSDVEVVKLAVPASPPQIPMSRQAMIKVAVAIFLGGLLGLMITLFRSAG